MARMIIAALIVVVWSSGTRPTKSGTSMAALRAEAAGVVGPLRPKRSIPPPLRTMRSEAETHAAALHTQAARGHCRR